MTSQPPALKLRTTEELLTSIPYMFGFRPRESLVVLGFEGKQVGFRCRVDLPADIGNADALAEILLSPIQHNKVEGALIVIYRDDDGRPNELDDAVHWAVESALTSAGIEVRNAIALRGSRWYSLVCSNPQCCPTDGTPFEQPDSFVASECVLRGATVEDDREALKARLAPHPPGSPAWLRMQQALDRVDDEWVSREIKPTQELLDRVTRDARRIFGQLLDAYDATGELPQPDDIAELLYCLMSIQARDALIRPTLLRLETAKAVLTAIVRNALDDELLAPPATLLGLAHWRDGNGAMAMIALERAEAADPTYRFAQMLIHGLSHGLPPEGLDGLTRPLPRPRIRPKRSRTKRRSA